MSDWQERITRETPPAIWAEHELRYRLAAPLIASSAVWADLGCGNGVAAATALGDARPDQIVLSDLDGDAIARAAEELGRHDARQVAGDFTDPGVLRAVSDALRDTEGDRVVTCFEVVEHLTTFVPLLEWAGELARSGDATFVISVPNDAFWSIENPFHAGCWGEGTFEELRRLLPEAKTLLRQVSLVGSAFASWDGEAAEHALTVDVGGPNRVATHFIAAFGPRHDKLLMGAVAVPAPQHEQRRWERQRESNLAFAEAQAATLNDAQADLRRLVAEQREWRTYIHELERELGRPLSGTGPEPGQS